MDNFEKGDICNGNRCKNKIYKNDDSGEFYSAAKRAARL